MCEVQSGKVPSQYCQPHNKSCRRWGKCRAPSSSCQNKSNLAVLAPFSQPSPVSAGAIVSMRVQVPQCSTILGHLQYLQAPTQRVVPHELVKLLPQRSRQHLRRGTHHKPALYYQRKCRYMLHNNSHKYMPSTRSAIQTIVKTTGIAPYHEESSTAQKCKEMREAAVSFRAWQKTAPHEATFMLAHDSKHAQVRTLAPIVMRSCYRRDAL